MRHPRSRPAEACRAPELTALLRDLDDLRLSLSTDLSLTAAALEAGAPDLAASVLESDRLQLLRFEQQALAHLKAAEQAGPVDPPAAIDPPAAVELPAPRRARRALLMPAAPLMAAAAAVLGVLAGLSPVATTEPPPQATTRMAMTSYARLTQLTLDGADATAVARAAERLHDELATIVAQASADPAAAQEALALLESEALVLDSSQDREQLTDVIAQARALVARLRAALPVPVRAPRTPAPSGELPVPSLPLGPAASPSAVPLPPQDRPEPTPPPSEKPSSQEPAPSEPPPGEEPSPSGQEPPADGEPSFLPGSVVAGG